MTTLLRASPRWQETSWVLDVWASSPRIVYSAVENSAGDPTNARRAGVSGVTIPSILPYCSATLSLDDDEPTCLPSHPFCFSPPSAAAASSRSSTPDHRSICNTPRRGAEPPVRHHGCPLAPLACMAPSRAHVSSASVCRTISVRGTNWCRSSGFQVALVSRSQTSFGDAPDH